MEKKSDLKAVVDSLRRVVRAIRTSSHEAESKVGITGAQLFVMQQLRDKPDASLREVADGTLTDQSSVSVVVSRLVERKLVSRRPSSRDGRRVELALTTLGRAQLAHAPEVAQDRLVRALKKVPAVQLRTMKKVLDVLVHDLGAALQPAEMFFEDRHR